MAILFDYTFIYDAYNSIEDLVFFTESQMSGNEYHYFTTTCTTWFELLLSFMDVCFLGRLIQAREVANALYSHCVRRPFDHIYLDEIFSGAIWVYGASKLKLIETID